MLCQRSRELAGSFPMRHFGPRLPQKPVWRSWTCPRETPYIQRRHLGVVIAVAHRIIVNTNTKTGRDMLWRIRPARLLFFTSRNAGHRIRPYTSHGEELRELVKTGQMSEGEEF
jgi:hypothetical protein